MRKSKLVTLTMLTSTAAMIAACQPAPPSPENKVFATAEQCVAGGGTKADCDKAAAEAAATRTEHASKEACEAQYGVGKCETKQASNGSSGGSVFVPAMMGFMMGQMMSNGSRAPAAAFSGSTSNLTPANNSARSFVSSGGSISRGGMATASSGRGGVGA